MLNVLVRRRLCPLLAGDFLRQDAEVKEIDYHRVRGSMNVVNSVRNTVSDFCVFPLTIMALSCNN